MPRILVLTLASLLLLPAVAHAGGAVGVNGDRLVYTGTDGADKVAFGIWPSTGELLVEQVGLDASAGPSEVGPGCVREVRTAGDVPRIFCQPAGVKTIVATFGGGDDQAAFLVPPGSPLTRTADMGDGDDILQDNYGGGEFTLGDGDDSFSARGPATADGGAGDDDLGCGDDNKASRKKAAFVFDGGLGEDRLCGGLKDDRLDGGSADDKVFAGEGDDRLNGDAGDDQLDGGDDADQITGGSGEDEIDGGAGKDVIKAKDRREDDISCGSKRDTVFVDRVDLLSRCELIRR